jgi:predicted HTH transcriptional regulator
MTSERLRKLLDELLKQPKESEWVEFKLNFHSPEEIGERISALANGACLHDQEYGYLVYGIADDGHGIDGTTFKARSHKKGKEDLEHWLIQRLSPRLDFRTEEFDVDGKHLSMYIIPAAQNTPVEFIHTAYIRIASITRKLHEFPEKARKIWKKGPQESFEQTVALDGLTADQVVSLLDTQSYFDRLKLPYPSHRDAVLERFASECLIKKSNKGYGITNLGALVFAKNLEAFPDLKRKAARVIIYDGKNKLKTIREQIGTKGYAVGFEGLVEWVNAQLPTNEVIGQALRKEVRMYPEIAVRELIANALIHQDLNEKGFLMVEVYADRIEITNPGIPLITPERFIDEYQSRNEKLADLLRRLGICEEKGSGIDKVIASTEIYQLPAPDFIVQERHTKSVMFAYKELREMDKKDRIRACYQHCCLRYVTNEKMTNQTLRERLQIKEGNAAIASRIIKETLLTKLIKDDDPDATSKKFARYVPFWA